MTLRRLLVALMVAGFVMAAASLPYIDALRVSTRRVEFAVSLDSAREFAATHQFPLGRIFEGYRASGATTVVVAEKSLSEFVTQGQLGYPTAYTIDLALVTGAQVKDQARLAGRPTTVSPDHNELFLFVRNNPDLTQWLEQRFRTRLGGDRVKRHVATDFGLTPETQVLSLVGEQDWILALPLGIFSHDLETVKAAGLAPVFSLRQARGVNYAEPTKVLNDLPSGPQRLLFPGEMAPGWPDDLQTVGEALRKRGDNVLVEFRRHPRTGELVRVGGLEELASAVDYRVTRVYRPRVGDRLADWTDAISTSGIRMILWDTPIPHERPDDYLNRLFQRSQALRDTLVRQGYEVGIVSGAHPYGTPSWALAGVVMFVASGAAWLALTFWKNWSAAFTVALVLAAGLIWPAGGDRQLLAVAAATVATVIAAWLAVEGRRLGLAAVARAFGIVMAGGLVAGLLVQVAIGEPSTLLDLVPFAHAGLAVVVPILVFVLLHLVLAGREILTAMTRWVARPVRLGHVVALGLLGVAAAVLMATSPAQQAAGDLQPAHLSLLERAAVRLELLLGALPLGTGFLTGSFALGVAVAMRQNGHPNWALVFMAVGLTTATAVVQLYSNVHLPASTLVARTGHSLWLGLVVATCTFLITCRLIRSTHGRERHE